MVRKLLVGGGEEFARLGPGAACHTEGDGDRQLAGPFSRIQLVELVGDTTSDEPAKGEVAAGDNDAEVIAADAGCGVTSTNATREAKGGTPDHVIASIVAMDFVDDASATDIDKHERDGLARLAGLGAGIAQFFIEGVAVGEPGQVVGAGLAFEPTYHGVAPAKTAVFLEGPFDTGCELLGFEVCLADEVVGAKLERGEGFTFVLAAGEQHDSDIVAVLPQVRRQLVAASGPRCGINQDNVEHTVIEQSQGFFSGTRRMRDEFTIVQQLPHAPDIVEALIDDEDAQDALPLTRWDGPGNHKLLPRSQYRQALRIT